MARMIAGSWLDAYAHYTHVSEAPLLFDFWTGVATVAGALRRQVYIDEIKFKIYPNFYIFFVAPAGVATKSTTVGVGMRLLRQVDGITMGPASLTWQGLTKGLSNAKQLIPLSDPNTTDPLAMEYMPQSCVVCEASELGTFLDMRNGELVSILIDLWDGKDVPWERWLSTQENTKIENPLISIIGATTPTWLEENFGESAIGGGLTSRIIFVYGDTKRRLIPYISDLVEDEQNKQNEEALVHDLREIAKLKGKMEITRGARTMVGEWYEKHWTGPEKHIAGPRFSGYRARKFAHLHKLATVLSVSESDDLVIREHHIAAAFFVLKGMESGMLTVLSNMGKVISSKHMDLVLENVKAHGQIEKHNLWIKCMTSMSMKEFGEAIDGLVSAQLIRIVNYGGQYLIELVSKNEGEEVVRVEVEQVEEVPTPEGEAA